MSLPTTALANVRVTSSWIDRPFTEFGDTATKVYYLRCHCLESQYVPPVLDVANLTNASTAKVFATRYADPQARWVGDYDFAPSDGGYITFIRRFANIPATHSEYTDSVVSLPSNFDRVVSLNYLIFRGGDYALSTRLEFKYALNPASIVRVKPFAIKQTATNAAVQFVTNSGKSLDETTPDGAAFYSSTERASEATKVSRWMGNIYVGVTPYVKPVDAFSI